MRIGIIVLLLVIILEYLIIFILIKNYRNLLKAILENNFFNLSNFNKKIFSKAYSNVLNTAVDKTIENYLNQKALKTMSIEDYIEYCNSKKST